MEKEKLYKQSNESKNKLKKMFMSNDRNVDTMKAFDKELEYFQRTRDLLTKLK